MIKRLTLILILLTGTLTAKSQVTITGTVFLKEDGLPLPGVNVVEKGTKNGTVATIEGTFSLNVSDLNSTLIFSSIGMITLEYPLKGQSQLSIKMKSACYKDFFDSNHINVYYNSGVIHNPVGGQIEVASPYVFLGGVVKGIYSFQTNFDENEFQNGQVEFSHFISNCDFDMDFKLSYRKVSFEKDLDSRAHSFETDLNLKRIKLIAGYSHLDFKRIETMENQTSSGILGGLGIYIGKPFYSTVVGKVYAYKNNIEYQSYIQSQYKRFCYFAKFYKLNSFNELSLGVGAVIDYRLKSR
ncbi:hypothetical protein GZH53_01160 [Flavihumibacter sp. R14]|nr:hypothetical protein [Flavihumibacter soli]